MNKKSYVRILSMASVFGMLVTNGCSSLSGMGPVAPQLESMEKAVTLSNAYAAEKGRARVRSYRDSLLTAHTSITRDGEEPVSVMLAAGSTSEINYNAFLNDVAIRVLCDAQALRFVGTEELAAVEGLSKSLNSFTYKKQETLAGSLKLLSSTGKPPKELNAENAGSAPGKRATETCEDDVANAVASLIVKDDTSVESFAAFNVITLLNNKVKPKAVALLDLIISIRQRGRLNSYVSENKEKIKEIQASIKKLKKSLIDQDNDEVRTALALDYLVALDSLAIEMRGRKKPKATGFLPAGTVVISSTKSGKAVLEKAAAYDAFQAATEIEAFAALEKALGETLKIPDASPTTLLLDTQSAYQSFSSALTELADAFDDEELKKALGEL